MVTFESIRQNEDIKTYIERADVNYSGLKEEALRQALEQIKDVM